MRALWLAVRRRVGSLLPLHVSSRTGRGQVGLDQPRDSVMPSHAGMRLPHRPDAIRPPSSPCPQRRRSAAPHVGVFFRRICDTAVVIIPAVCRRRRLQIGRPHYTFVMWFYVTRGCLVDSDDYIVRCSSCERRYVPVPIGEEKFELWTSQCHHSTASLVVAAALHPFGSYMRLSLSEHYSPLIGMWYLASSARQENINFTTFD